MNLKMRKLLLFSALLCTLVLNPSSSVLTPSLSPDSPIQRAAAATTCSATIFGSSVQIKAVSTTQLGPVEAHIIDPPIYRSQGMSETYFRGRWIYGTVFTDVVGGNYDFFVDNSNSTIVCSGSFAI